MSVRGVVKTVLGAAAGVAASVGAILAFRKKNTADDEADNAAAEEPPQPAQGGTAPTPQPEQEADEPMTQPTADEDAVTEAMDPQTLKSAVAEPADEPVAEVAEAEVAEAEVTEAEVAVSAPAPVEVAKPAVEAAPVVEAITVKGVHISDPAAFVAAANAADEAGLKAIGLKGKALKLVLAGQPFASAEALGSTAGIGPKSVQALAKLV